MQTTRTEEATMEVFERLQTRIAEVGFTAAREEHEAETRATWSDDVLLAQYEKWHGLYLRTGVTVARDIARGCEAELERRTA
jgi:hypothetical protein